MEEGPGFADRLRAALTEKIAAPPPRARRLTAADPAAELAATIRADLAARGR